MTLTTLIIDDEKLARQELRYLLDSLGEVEVLAEAANGIEAIELIDEHHPDLVFLDVQMPGLDGFAALKKLIERRKKSAGKSAPQPLPEIIFATAYDQYAVQAFDVNAVDYILKPFDRARLQKALDRVRTRLAERALKTEIENEAPILTENSPHLDSQIDALLKHLSTQRAASPARIVVQSQSRLLLVDQSDICYAAIDEGVIRVVTQSFEGLSKCRTLEELQDQLDQANFWRAHRGFIVNINHIREVVPWFKSSYQLRMNDKQQTEIPVSRAQTRRLRELFNL
jgi:two-component system LytT family response regulator/two-component system response regulator LytT